MKKRLSADDKFLLTYYVKELIDSMYYDDFSDIYYTPESVLITMDREDMAKLRKILSE